MRFTLQLFCGGRLVVVTTGMGKAGGGGGSVSRSVTKNNKGIIIRPQSIGGVNDYLCYNITFICRNQNSFFGNKTCLLLNSVKS